MSSYGSSHSGYIHPSHYQQYPPQPQPQHQHQQPPYPTTPGPPGPSQPQAFYPPPQQQQHQLYSTSPTTPFHQPVYSTSPSHQPTGPPQAQHRRTSSSASQHQRPPFAQFASAPIAIPQSHQAPVYARRTSHGSQHSHHADGEDKAGNEWGLDDETLRQYEKRYAKDRELEKRPTLGGSLIGLVRALGGKRG